MERWRGGKLDNIDGTPGRWYRWYICYTHCLQLQVATSGALRYNDEFPPPKRQRQRRENSPRACPNFLESFPSSLAFTTTAFLPAYLPASMITTFPFLMLLKIDGERESWEGEREGEKSKRVSTAAPRDPKAAIPRF
jgi:hypothetical protein